MGSYIAQRIVKMLAKANHGIADARVGILGFPFKDNVPDIRTSKVRDLYQELRAFGITPIVHDPLADPDAIRRSCGIDLCDLGDFGDLSALILAVPHDDYSELDGSKLGAMLVPNGILVDIKSRVDSGSLRQDLQYWSL